MLCGKLIREHYRHPRNYGSLERPDIVHEDVNPLCGDRIRIEVKVGLGEQVADIRFRGDACMISLAAGSILTEMVKEWRLTAVCALWSSELLQALEVQIRPARLKCALLPLEILQAGIASYQSLRRVGEHA